MKLFSTLIFIFLLTTALFGAFQKDIPITVKQPDNSELSCFASGDEFVNWLHDEDGFTIIQSPDNGYYYYGQKIEGRIVPSDLRVGEGNPAGYGLNPYQIPDRNYYEERRRTLETYDNAESFRAPHSGVFNNLIIYIRFNDQTEFPTPREEVDLSFNDSSPEAQSLYSYFKEVSYGDLDILSHHYPICEPEFNISYQDPHDRSYYCVYNSETNPNGYQNPSQAVARRTQLLANAINFVAPQIPDSLMIDADENGTIDNICFMIRGQPEAWGDLLWGHRSALTNETVYVNGVRAWDYTFQFLNDRQLMVICHEMFHVLGAPDLYLYSDAGANPNGPYSSWDLMNGSLTHMSAYMKYRYGFWIDDIPVISDPGRYTLYPLLYEGQNCYRIPSPNSNTEYFVVEYRKKIPGTFENNCPGSGLTFSRVNYNLDGQGNPMGPPYELYLYRPGGDVDSDGNVDGAHFSADMMRTEFNDNTNPGCFLSNGSPGGLYINQISEASDSISFYLYPSQGYIIGSVSSNSDDFDVTEVDILANGEIYNPIQDGSFVITLYQGSYTIEISAPGHATQIHEIEVPAADMVGLDVELQYLESPFDLEYTVNGSDIELTWDFDNYTDSFTEFNIYLVMNGHANNIRSTTETSTVFNFPSQLNMSFYVTAEYSEGESASSNLVDIDYTDVNEINENIVLSNLNYSSPNPFVLNKNNRVSLNIYYQINERDSKKPIQLDIYNVKGQCVKSLLNETVKPGNHSIIWNGKDSFNQKVSSGVYFYRLQTSSTTQTKKMLLIK